MLHQYPADALQRRDLPFNDGNLLYCAVANFPAACLGKRAQYEQFLYLRQGESQSLRLLDEVHYERRFIIEQTVIAGTPKCFRQ